jgi:PilZ domain-containing protein
MTDKRQSQRVSYACEVSCTGVGMGVSPLNPRISDVSATGAFIDCMTQIPQGSKVKLKFSLGGREVSCSAEVAHSMPSFGMGVKFLDLTEEDRKTIEAFVQSAG